MKGNSGTEAAKTRSCGTRNCWQALVLGQSRVLELVFSRTSGTQKTSRGEFGTAMRCSHYRNFWEPRRTSHGAEHHGTAIRRRSVTGPHYPGQAFESVQL